MKEESKLALGSAFGVAIGSAIGVVTDNLGLWISLGTGIGAAIGFTLMRRKEEANDDKSS